MGAIGRTNTGGAGLNLTILASVTQPGNPVENLVWINTSTAIPHWYWQAAEPSAEEKEEGALWIAVNSLATNKLDVLRNNNLIVGFGTAKQWINNAWVTVGGKIYHSGSWHNLQTFVYDGTIGSPTGNYNADIGGQPWTTGTDGGSVTITNYNDHFTISFDPYGQQWTATNKKIDFTDVKTVKFTYTASGVAGNLIVYTNKNTSGVRYPNASAAWTSGSSKHSTSINVSGLTGQFWLGTTEGSAAAGQSGSINIFSIELIS